MKLTKQRLLCAVLGLGTSLAWMVLSGTVRAQGFTTTTVQGTVYLANGHPGSGSLQVSWPTFTTANNQAVTAGRMNVTIGTDGYVSVNLAANLGATPAGLYYTAVYHLSDGTTSTEYWVVPAAAQASLSQVRAQVMPAAQAVQTVSKAYVDQSVQELTQSLLTASGGSLSGPLYLNGDPIQPTQAASKHYVDTEFGMAVPMSGGALTGPLTSVQLGAAYQVDQFPGADFGAKLQACVNALNATYGGTCDARNFSGNLVLSSNLILGKANATVQLPCATISTSNQIKITAGTRNVTLHGCALRGASASSGSAGGTVFLYSGTGAMMQVGDPTHGVDTPGFHIDNAVINTTGSTSSTAEGLAAYRTQEMNLASLYFLGNSNQTGMTLDGTGNYTGGTFQDVELGGFGTAVNGIGHQTANSMITDWANASTFLRLHIDCPTNSGNPVAGTYGINLQQGDGNTFTGGDVEGCSTALHLGPNAQNNTIVGLRTENSTNQVVADAGSSYNNWITGGTMFTGQLTDNGTRNSFLDTFHRSFNGLNGDWYGSQQDATVTNHFRLGTGNGNERGLLNRYQTDSGYRWTTGFSDATAGEQFYQVLDEQNNVYRLSIGQYNNGQSSSNNQTVINAAGSGAVVLNGSSNSGTGGILFGSGGTNAATVGSINNAGNAQFNGTLQVGGPSTFSNSTTVKNQVDAEIDNFLWAGATANQKESYTYKDYTGASQWYMVKDANNNWALNSAPGGLDSFKAYQSTNSGDTYINASNPTGHIRLNYETGSGAETDIYSGASSGLVAAFLGSTAIKFPGLAATSGHNCLQIDNSGYISNSGLSCGTSLSGTVNTGNTGQVAYYAGNGNVIAGMNAVAVNAGGTGASSAAQALQNLGAQSVLTGVASDGASGIAVAGTVAAGTAVAKSIGGISYAAQYNGIVNCFAAGKTYCVADPTLSLTEQYAFNNPVPNMGANSAFADQRSGISIYSHNWQTSGKNFGTNSALFDYCLRETWIPSAGFNGHSGCHDEYSVDTTPGNTFGNGGTSTTGWYIPIHKLMNFTVNGSGISMVTNETLTKYGAGDAITQYLYNTGMNGFTAASDEGGKALGMGVIESTAVYTGTCQSGCSTGSTLIKTTAVTGAGTQGTNRYIIDTTQSPITGQVTAIAAGLSGSGGSALTITSTVPVSNAWGTISTPNPSTPVNSQPPFSTSETFTLAITSGTFDTTHVLCFSNHYHECSIPTSVGTPSGGFQSVTMPVRKGHITGDAVCQGGLAGYALEMISYTQGSVRYPLDVWCSTGTNTIQSLAWNTSAAQTVPFTSAIYDKSNFTSLTNQISCTAVASGTGVYTCTVPAGGNGLNPYNGKSITFSTFAQPANNGTFTITSTTATSVTTNNSSSGTDTTGVATTTVMSATYNAAGSTLFCPTCQTKGTFAIASASDSQLNGNCNNVVWSSSTVMTCNASNISDTATHIAATATGANSQPGTIVGLNNFNLWPMAEVLDVQNEIGPFNLTAASTASGGNTTYTGTGLTNACPSASIYRYSVTGFTNAGNNVTNVACVSSTATTLVLANSGGVSETNPGIAGIANRLDGTFALEPNPMVISPGDTLEETHLEAAKYQAFTANVASTNPFNTQYGATITVQGSGAWGGSSSGGSNARLTLSNLNADTIYRGIGTGFQTPPNIMNAGGSYDYGFVFDHGPQNGAALFQLTLAAAQSNDINYSYYPFFFTNKTGQTALQIAPNSGNTTLSTVTQGTLTLQGASGMTIGQNAQTTTFSPGSTVAFAGTTVTGLPSTTTWSSIGVPTANLGMAMGNYTTAFTWGSGTSGNMFSLTDSAGNTGSNAVLAVNTNATSSAIPFQIAAKGTTYYQWQNNGALSMLSGAQTNVCGTCGQTMQATAATSGANHGSSNLTQSVSVWNGSVAASGNCNQATGLVSTSATNSNSYWQLSCTPPASTTMDVRLAGVTDLQVPGIISIGTRFTTSGCSATPTAGGATAGTFTLGANSCTVVITLNGATGITAPTGWTCAAHDRTAPTVLIGGESSSTTTTASITIPAGAGTTDVISFSCTAF